MVNVTKRMHKLMPKLWRVKGGAGAAILPPKAPAPQLTSVLLQIPNPANGYDGGARSFWKKFLPALKYHNLTLPIQVTQKTDATPAFAPTLTLNFEATTREALEKQTAQPRLTDEQSVQKWRDDLEWRHSRLKLAEVRGSAVVKKSENSWVDQLRKQQEEIGIPQDQRTAIGEITTKPQPAADPSAPSTTSPPVTLYQRSITLGLRGRYALDIWMWFQKVTRARPYKLRRDERTAVRRHARYEVGAEKDRQRVKKGIDAMKREREDLKRAKNAAERMAEA